MKAPMRWLICGVSLSLLISCDSTRAPQAGAVAPGKAAATHPGQIRVLSNRADLVSGGDALVEVLLPAGVSAAGVRMHLGAADVTAQFAQRANGRYMGLLTGLAPGVNELRADFGGGLSERLAITNYPSGGPIFSGAQVQPWICTTDSNGLGAPQDAQCSAPAVVSYVYKNAVTGQFQAYDPASPPAAAMVATTTTDEGHTVPYIVRKERGSVNRAIYDFAVLADPAAPWEPWAPQAGWNRKLGYSFGQSCAPGHSQASAQDPMIGMFLDRGFAVAVSTLNVMGNACNLNVSAETMMMVKEMVIERLGEIRYTIGNGCSGGAEGQNSIADNYPGLLDGIRPECTFADGWTPAIASKSDCALLSRYFNTTSPQLWAVEAQRGAVLGNPTDSHCVEMAGLGSAPQDWDPAGSGCGDIGTAQYDAATNPTGTRCTMQDYNKASVGLRPDGFANGLLDDEGIQWGLAALEAGTILPDQFVDLNEKIGGWTLDYQPQAARTIADVEGIRRFYRTGQFTYGRNLAKVATIDARTNNTADFHGNIHREIVRERQQRANGNVDAQVYWFEPASAPFGLPDPATGELTLSVMDQWLAAIEADTSSDPIETKVVRNKPASADEGGCYLAGEAVPPAACEAVYEAHTLARIVAGAPRTADVLKCQLKPLDRADYAVTFTDAQWTRLQAAFPTGVCDWSKPGVEQVPPIGDWITLADQDNPHPLGPAPVSSPVGAVPPPATPPPAVVPGVDADGGRFGSGGIGAGLLGMLLLLAGLRRAQSGRA
ncbi:MAG TPA: DUF6351 family protein [Solimonas sp.]|nr:DUF6351 family protein [Solimonas sp.]